MAEKNEASIDLLTNFNVFMYFNLHIIISCTYMTQFYELKVNIVELNNCSYNMLFQIYYSGILLIDKQNFVCIIRLLML